MATRHGILLTRDYRRAGADDRSLRRAADRGELVRVARGAFLPRAIWDAMSVDDRYRARARATALAGRPEERSDGGGASGHVLSHQSAAAIWGMPSIGPWPTTVHLLTTPATGSRTQGGVTRHAAELDPSEVVELEGIRLTSPIRTLVDVARCLPFGHAVAMWDWALSKRAGKARVSPGELERVVAQLERGRGGKRVARVSAFADGRAGSPGESLSRVLIWELGFPRPELQKGFYDRRGLIGLVDFWWEKYLLIGEFDGNGKYLGDRFGNTLPSDRIVVLEKQREDRLRALGNGVTRWDWPYLRDPGRLFDLLHDAGLRVERRPTVIA